MRPHPPVVLAPVIVDSLNTVGFQQTFLMCGSWFFVNENLSAQIRSLFVSAKRPPWSLMSRVFQGENYHHQEEFSYQIKTFSEYDMIIRAHVSYPWHY